MEHPRRVLALLVAAAVSLTACGDGSAEPSDSGRPVSPDGAYVLATATVDGADLALDPGYRVTLTVDGAEVGGTAACNHYGGTAAVDGNAFVVGDLAMTEMACEPRVMEIEQAYTAALLRVTTAERTGDLLTLEGDGVSLTFTELPPVPTSDLVGVTWVLETLVYGETASSTLAGADPATLRLEPDGMVTATTGCRRFTGEYTVSSDTVLFNTFGQAGAGECTGDIARQDDHVVTVLGDGFTAQIEGDRLTLDSGAGLGLVYRADG